MAVSKRLRFEVLRRDNHTCRYCGAAAPDVKLTVDHVIPSALGGADEPSNLVAACGPCNSGKTSSSPDAPIVEDVEQDALRWAKAMKVVADRALERLDHERDVIQGFAVTWGEYHDAEFEIQEGEWEVKGTVYPWAVLRNGRAVEVCWDEGMADAARYDREVAAEAPMPDDWHRSIVHWHRLGIHPREMYDLVDGVMCKDRVAWSGKWRYFAGCCWGLLRQRQEEAAALLADGDV